MLRKATSSISHKRYKHHHLVQSYPAKAISSIEPSATAHSSSRLTSLSTTSSLRSSSPSSSLSNQEYYWQRNYHQQHHQQHQKQQQQQYIVQQSPIVNVSNRLTLNHNPLWNNTIISNKYKYRYNNTQLNHNQRLFSTDNNPNNKITGWESNNSIQSINNGGSKIDDNFLFGFDKQRVFLGLGFVSVGAAIITLPILTRQVGDKEFEYNEIEVEDDGFQSMKDISSDIEGEITKRILGEELSQQLVEGGKKKAVDNTVTLVSDVLNSEALQSAITTLITRVVGSEQFQTACQMLLKNLWDDLINDPETTAQVVALLNTAIQDERIKKSFKELILGLLNDEEVKKELTGLIVQLGEEQEILDATRELLTESAHRALNDPEILDHSMEFATDVVGDNVLQRTSGEALRNTVTYAVKPSLSAFLSVFGLALLFFSASALGNARMSANQGKEIDAAASLVIKNISNHAVSIMAKILSIPKKAVSGLASAILATALYPFQLIGKAVGAIGEAGNAVINSVVDIFARAASFPAFVKDVLSLFFSAFIGSLSNIFDKSYLLVSSLPELIASQTRTWISVLVGSIRNLSTSMGTYLYSSLMSVLTSTGAKVSNVLGQLISASRAKVDKAGSDFLEVFSNIVSNFLAYFYGNSKGASSS